MLISFPSCILAIERDDYIVHVEDRTNVRTATAEEIAFNSKYCINLEKVLLNEKNRTNWVDSIISFAVLEKTQNINGRTCTYFKLTNPVILLPYCDSSNVSMLKYGDYLYIDYNTVDGLEVYLCYNMNGCTGKVIYDASSDVAFVEVFGVSMIYEHFKEGGIETIPEEMVEYIFKLLRDGEMEALYSIEGISIESTDTYICVSPSVSMGTRANGYTNESDLFNSLINSFPTTSWISYLSRFCSYLNTNVSIRVTRTRNQYVRSTANWRSFGIGTALNTISGYLSLGASTVGVILSLLGIGISAYDTIQNAVTLYRSAVYNYQESYVGSVYDTVTLNKYVKMTWQYNGGTFTGGYDSNGNFTWIESYAAPALQVSPETIADTAIYNYNAELVLYGMIVNYYPE